MYFSTNNFVPQYAELQTYMTVIVYTLVLIILFLNVGTQLYYTLVMQTYVRINYTNNFVPQYAEMQTYIRTYLSTAPQCRNALILIILFLNMQKCKHIYVHT